MLNLPLTQEGLQTSFPRRGIFGNLLENCGAPLFTLKAQSELPKFNKSLSVLGWAYNEEELIEKYLRRIDQLLKDTVSDYEIVIVNDASTDRTGEIIRNLKNEIPRMVLIENERNLNVWLSFKRAFEASTKEYIFWQTVDWSYRVDYFRTFLELLKEYDVIAGVRRPPVRRGGGWFQVCGQFFHTFGMDHLKGRSDNLYKAMVSITNYFLIRALFQVPLSDYQNVCIYPASLIKSHTIEAKSSFGNPELLIKSYWQGASIKEVPITFIARQAGKAKGTKPKSILASIQDILYFWFLWRVCKKWKNRGGGKIHRVIEGEWESLS